MRAADQVPVLLIVFNRPDKVRRMIDTLRPAAPRRIFVAADGPRAGVPDDDRRCAQVRRCLDAIDWPCEVRRLEHPANLGCKRGPEAAIGWFLAQVEAGVILEDDCLPTPDFLPFCAELLERYRDEERVMMISGHNMLGESPPGPDSYAFSRTSPTWGWATWRRAWRHYDPDLTAWATPDGRRAVRERTSGVEFRLTGRLFDRVRAGELQAWDFAWAHTMLRAGGLSVVPAANMITNIGFGDDATHTRNRYSPEARLRTATLAFPLAHPRDVEASAALDGALYRLRFPPRRRVMILLPTGVANWVRRWVYAGMARFGGGARRPEPARIAATAEEGA